MASVSGTERLLQLAQVQGSPATRKHVAFQPDYFKLRRCYTLPLSAQRFHVRSGLSRNRAPRACDAGTDGINHGVETVDSREDTLSPKITQSDSHPWVKFLTKLTHQVADSFWFFGKWIFLPTLIIMGLRDAILAVATGHELWIPLGLLAGTLFTGILKETWAVLGIEFQQNILPWHFVGLALLFVIIRIGASKIYPFTFRMFLYHFVIGGLWQTMRFCVDWKKKNEQSLQEDTKK